jgi:predicted nicotinamide N-methyase
MPEPPRVLRTSAGEMPLHDYRVRIGGREWSVLHTGAVLTLEEEMDFLREQRDRVPYGVVLWPAAIALAHEIAARRDACPGRRVLELGAGTGLPGILAASFGARVVQTDRQQLALSVCERNGARNDVSSIEHRLADWTHWDVAGRFDWILGSDILYAESMHAHLLRIFDTMLAPGGRLLLSDPFRPSSLALLEKMEASGWTVVVGKWSVAAGFEEPRAIGVFDLAPPS